MWTRFLCWCILVTSLSEKIQKWMRTYNHTAMTLCTRSTQTDEMKYKNERTWNCFVVVVVNEYFNRLLIFGVSASTAFQIFLSFSLFVDCVIFIQMVQLKKMDCKKRNETKQNIWNFYWWIFVNNIILFFGCFLWIASSMKLAHYLSRYSNPSLLLWGIEMGTLKVSKPTKK